MLDIQKEISEMLKKPDVLAVALVYSLVKPILTKQLGLDTGQEHQLVPQQAQQHHMPEQQQSVTQQPQMPIQPQAPTQQPKK